MSKFFVTVNHVPILTEFHLAGSQVDTLIKRELPSAQQIYLWDNDYYIVSLEDWGKVFQDVLLNMPKYTAEKYDCENAAMLATARVNEKYQLNTCGIAIGASPFGEHGYNVFVAMVNDRVQCYILEPQNGLVYDAKEDSGYLPRLIIMG